MKENLSLIASVSVVAIVIYAAYLLSDVDTASIQKINNTVKTISSTIGSDQAPAETSQTKIAIYAGIGLLLASTIYVLLKDKR
jgi:hypothetical protein